MPTAREHGLDTRMVSGDDIARLAPGAAARWKGGIYTASDGQAEPHKAAPAIARAAAHNGATILAACAARGIETQAGQVSAVVTEQGTIKTSVVLCAAGAWTSMFCRSLGIPLPQLTLNGTVVRTAPGPKALNTCLWDHRAGIRRPAGRRLQRGRTAPFSSTPSCPPHFALRSDTCLPSGGSSGACACRSAVSSSMHWRTPRRWRLDAPSPFEQTRVLNPQPRARAIAGIRSILAERFPQLAGIGIAEAWSGVVETTPDAVPVIDEAEALPGFYIATGLIGHGFGIGPGAGQGDRRVADGHRHRHRPDGVPAQPVFRWYADPPSGLRR